MIKTKNKIVGTIKTKNVLQGVVSPAELRIYPKLEDLEITPTNKDKLYKSENYYGYNKVLVKGTEGLAEDLTVELTEQDNLITIQKSSLIKAIEKLQGKTGGETGLVSIVSYNLEGTILTILLSNNQTLVINLSGSEDIGYTIAGIENLIVSELENKRIEEVEK